MGRSSLGLARVRCTAVTRCSRSGQKIAPGEAISAEAALRAVTIDAAWQLFAEDRVGSLELGKFADVTVTDRNPLTIDPLELDGLGVRETWIGGRRVEPMS